MQEIALVLAIVGVLAAVGFADALPAIELIEGGSELMFGAALVGIPLELLYFAALFAALTSSGVRPRGWYWRSFEHHGLLTASQRRWVLPSFYLGALCFVAITIGIAIVCLGLATLWLST